LIHLTEALGTPLGWWGKKVVTCYDLIPLRFPWHYLRYGTRAPGEWVSAMWRYQSATRVVAISQRTGDDIRSILKYPTARLDVVRTGIDLKRWQTNSNQSDKSYLIEKYGVSKPYALYVGYADKRKNAKGMFAALAHARGWVDIELVWAGSLPPRLKLELIKEASCYGVDKQLKFLDFVPDEDLKQLYKQAVAHLFLSRLEGFGLSVAEAMAAGCPVIVVRKSGADEVAGEAGIVVEADDAQAAGNALIRLTNSKELVQHHCQLGKDVVIRFSRTNMAKGYVSSYKKALGLRT
jgi:glycosyltransferase involved in cell wall biosynthesis